MKEKRGDLQVDALVRLTHPSALSSLSDVTQNCMKQAHSSAYSRPLDYPIPMQALLELEGVIVEGEPFHGTCTVTGVVRSSHPLLARMAIEI